MMRGQTSVLGLPTWVVVVLLIAGAWYAVNSGMLSIGGKPVTGPTAQPVITGVGQCPSDGAATLRVAAFESVVPTSGIKTKVTNADVYVYASADNQNFGIEPLATFNLSTGEYTSKICNQYVKLYIGRDQGTAGGYYFVQTDPVKIDQGLKQFSDIELDKIGTVVAEYDNGTAFRQTNPSITVNPGQKNTDLVFDLKENSGAVVHAPAMCFDYNSTIFSDVFVPGATKITTPDRLSSVNGKIACYDLGIDKLTNNQRTDKYTVEMDVKSDAPTNTTTSIGYTVIDKGTYLMNGQLMEGYENYNDANVGAPDTTGTITANIPA